MWFDCFSYDVMQQCDSGSIGGGDDGVTITENLYVNQILSPKNATPVTEWISPFTSPTEETKV